MTDRAAVVAKITGIILVGGETRPIDPGRPLKEQAVDSLELLEIAQAVEQEFFADDTTVILDAEPDWTIDKIADLVIAKLAAKEAHHLA